MREPKQAKNRSCIRPEVSRTHTFGAVGTSGGYFYAQFLEKMPLNEADIDWSKQYLDYLLGGQYDDWLKNVIANALVIGQNELRAAAMSKIEENKDCVVMYKDLDDFTKICRRLNMMSDHKFGMPRTSYRGIVIINWSDHRILFVPDHLKWSERTY